MAEEINKNLLLDPFKALGESVSKFAVSVGSATSPVFAAKQRLTDFNSQLANARSKFEQETIDRANAHNELMQTLAEGSQARIDAETEYQEAIKSSAEKFEETEKYLNKIIENEKNTLKIAEQNTSQQFGLGRGFERVGQGINSLQEGIKQLSFGLIDLTGETGKLGEFFKGLQNTVTGVISIGAGLAEMAAGVMLYAGMMGKQGEGARKQFKEAMLGLVGALKTGALMVLKTIGSTLIAPFVLIGKTLFGAAMSVGRGISGFVDGLFGDKKVDKKGKIRDSEGKFTNQKDQLGKPLNKFMIKTGETMRNAIGSVFGKKGIFANLFRGFGNMFKKVFGKGGIFAKAFTAIKTAGTMFLAGAMNFIKVAAGFLASSLAALGAFLIANAPIIALAAGIIALGLLVWSWYKANEDKIKPVIEDIIQVFKDIGSFIGDVAGRIWEGTTRAFSSVRELFTWNEDDTVLGKLTDIVYAPVNLAVNWVQGIFGWGDPDEPFKMSTFLGDTITNIKEWFTENFKFEIPKFDFSIADTFNQMLEDMGDWLDENLSWEKISSGLNPLNWFGGDDEEEPQGMFRGGSVQGGETYLVGEKGPEIFTPSVNGTIIPNHEIGSGSRLRGMNNEVQDGQRSGGGNQLVQTVMSSEQNANNTYNMQSSSKRTANSDPTLFKTAMVVPL